MPTMRSITLPKTNVKKGENILVAYNYNQLRRTFPNSGDYAKLPPTKLAQAT